MIAMYSQVKKQFGVEGLKRLKKLSARLGRSLNDFKNVDSTFFRMKEKLNSRGPS